MSGLEPLIRSRFEALSAKEWFSTVIDSSHFEVRELLAFMTNLAGKRILDAGCARGRFTKILAGRGALCTGIDFSETFIRGARDHIPEARFAVASLIRIPFGDDTFDGVCCIEVLEHIPDVERAVGELVRVLRPGGKILIIDKNIRSLHPRYLVPTLFFKRLQEYRNKWMYPRGFPFRERYFVPSRLQAVMNKFCGSTEVRFLTEGGGRWVRRIYKAVPSLTFDIAWRGIK